MSEVDEHAIKRIVDEAAVRDVHLRYCRGLDRGDFDLVRSCYHPGAIDHHGPYNGDVDGLLELIQGLAEGIESQTHFVGNQLVEVDGDVAWHEAYCIALHRMKPTDVDPAIDWTLNFRYFDRMERRDGRWGIAERVIIVDSERRDPVPVGGQAMAWHRGSADRHDPSYNRSRPQRDFLAARRDAGNAAIG